MTTTVEHPDGDAPRWLDTVADLQHATADGRWALQVRHAERYGRGDREIAAALARPFGPAVEAGVRASAADGRFLPRRALAGDLTWRLGGGVNLLAELRRQWYRPADAPASAVTLAGVQLERYAGAWRWAGGWTHARLAGGPGADAARLALDRWVGDAGRVGLVLAAGREVEATPQGVRTTRVRAAALLLRWDLDDGWLLDLSLGRTRVGDDGRRRDGAGLGVRRRF